jgi:hypothetical protein
MSIITGVIGSIQSAGYGFLDSIFARPGWGNPPVHSNYSPGNQGTPYDPGNALSSVPGIPVYGALRRTAYFGRWSDAGGNDHPELFSGTTQEILNDSRIVFANDSTQDNYMLEWKGYFRAPASGTYNWYCTADDVCWMWLGSAALSPDSNNFLTNTAHGTNPNSVNLVNNQWYPIRIRFQEWYGLETMLINFGPSGSELLSLEYWARDHLAWNGSSDGY